LTHTCDAIDNKIAHRSHTVVAYPHNTTLAFDRFTKIMIIRSGLVLSLGITEMGEQFNYLMMGAGCALGCETEAIDRSLAVCLMAVTDLEVCLLPVDLFLDAVNDDSSLLFDVSRAAADHCLASGKQSWMLQGTHTIDKIERFISVYIG
jgi:CRP-like cAMP-binding protein